MKLSLEVASGVNAGQVVPIATASFLIGRALDCQLRPASALVSQRHCIILVQGNRAFVRDLQSKNGTFVNDGRIQGIVELRDGDRLSVGPLVFRLAIKAGLENLETARTESKSPPPGITQSEEEAADLLLSLQPDSTPLVPTLEPARDTSPDLNLAQGKTLPSSPKIKTEGDAAQKAEKLLRHYVRSLLSKRINH